MCAEFLFVVAVWVVASGNGYLLHSIYGMYQLSYQKHRNSSLNDWIARYLESMNTKRKSADV